MNRTVDSFCNSVIAMLSLAAMSVHPAMSQQVADSAVHDAAYYAFRNAVAAPENPTGSTPRFELSKDYPYGVPSQCGQECPWTQVNVDFKPTLPTPKSQTWHGQNWDVYLAKILDYVKQGQDPNLSDAVGWRVKVGGKTRWFNVPWMAYNTTSGREYVHGTTNERTARLHDLVKHTSLMNFAGEIPTCKSHNRWGYETWSVGYYNDYGGYAIGRAIPSNGIPQLSTYMGSPIPAGLPFPEGTVVVKILTSSIPVDCAPFLKNAPGWRIDRHKFTEKDGYSCDRQVQVSHVVQVDVAVVDHRSPIGWVYGTYAYDSNLNGATFWDNLVPVGLQWGSDPWTYPAVPHSESLALQQTVLNTDVETFQHLGCGGRLAGPVDNAASSCTSCHASAYAAPHGAVSQLGVNVPPSFGFDGMCLAYSLENAAYFQNPRTPQAFPSGRFAQAITMDTSLQLAVAFREFGQFNTEHEPAKCTNPNQLPGTDLPAHAPQMTTP